MIWLLIGGFVWLGALTATRRMGDRIAALRVTRRQNLKLEADISRKVALAAALAGQTASDRASAEFERREAAWLLTEAKKLGAVPQQPTTRDESSALGWTPRNTSNN